MIKKKTHKYTADLWLIDSTVNFSMSCGYIIFECDKYPQIDYVLMHVVIPYLKSGRIENKTLGNYTLTTCDWCRNDKGNFLTITNSNNDKVTLTVSNIKRI